MNAQLFANGRPFINGHRFIGHSFINAHLSIGHTFSNGHPSKGHPFIHQCRECFTAHRVFVLNTLRPQPCLCNLLNEVLCNIGSTELQHEEFLGRAPSPKRIGDV
eukprot:1143894-Pelagomonas_calceolata.AAC.9